MKWRVSNEYWIEAESREKAMEKFGAVYKEDDWTITEVENADDVTDDLFLFFGSVLNRINEAREKRGDEKIIILDSEVAKACGDYHKDHPRDYLLLGAD